MAGRCGGLYLVGEKMRRTRPTFKITRYLTFIILLIILHIVFIIEMLTEKSFDYWYICVFIISAGIINLIIVNHTESYAINNGQIIVRRGFREYQIAIPSSGSLLLSYADDGPGFTGMDPVRGALSVHKSEFSLSIINTTDIKMVVNKIDTGHYRRLSPEQIKHLFYSEYVYSFEYNLNVLTKLTNASDFTILLPKSIATVIKDDLRMISFIEYDDKLQTHKNGRY